MDDALTTSAPCQEDTIQDVLLRCGADVVWVQSMMMTAMVGTQKTKTNIHDNDNDKKDGSLIVRNACSSCCTTSKPSGTTNAVVEQNDILNMALMVAVEANQLELIHPLLKQGAMVNTINQDGWTPLILVSQWDRPDIIQLLLDSGAWINHQTNAGNTALMIAAAKKQYSTLLTLLEYHKKNNNNCVEMVNASNKEGATALIMCAACSSRQDHRASCSMIQLLLDHGAFINHQTRAGNTAFMIALASHCRETSYLLMEKGATMNTVNQEGWTPLLLAAQWGVHHIIEIRLHNNNADTSWINHPNDDGNTALMIAVFNEHYLATQFLVQWGASIHTVNKAGWTPLMMAAKHSTNGMVQLLQNKDGNTALMIALHSPRSNLVQALLEHGAMVNIVNNQGWTPLMYAVINHFHGCELVKWLLNKGARMDHCNEDGNTALMVALDKKCHDTAELLLELGAAVHVINKKGWTPLVQAASNGNLHVVQKLLNHGALINHAPNCIDPSRRTIGLPILIATQKGYLSIVHVILTSIEW